MPMKAVAIMLVAAVITACADMSPRPSVAETRDIYARHAGGEIEHVHFTSIRNWQPAGYNALAIEFGPRQHYLFTVTAPCEFDLQFVPTIAVINTQPNRVTRFDSIRVGRDVCRITSIRPLNMAAVREDLKRADRDEPESRDGIDIENVNQGSGGT